MKERKRKHDDVHWPRPEKGGRGHGASKMAVLVPDPTLTPCRGCSMVLSKCVCAEDADREMGLDRPWKD